MKDLKLVKTYYDFAKIVLKEKRYIDEEGLCQGLVESFYENGNLMKTCMYLDGLVEKF